MIRQGKSYFLMLDVLEGGIVNPIEFNASNLQPERSILIMDEETQTVWLWHGAKRALVPRRMALRQAESLKGHGYQAGNAIVGRDLSKIVEIDARKIGREPETTELNDRLMALLNRNFTNIGHFLHVVGDEQRETPNSLPMKQKEAPKPAPMPPG